MDAKWWPECLRHIRQWQKLGFGRLSATVKVTAPQRHEPLCILDSLPQASSREAWHRGCDVRKSVRYGSILLKKVDSRRSHTDFFNTINQSRTFEVKTERLPVRLPEAVHQRHEPNIEQGLLMKRLALADEPHEPLYVTGRTNGRHHAAAIT